MVDMSLNIDSWGIGHKMHRIASKQYSTLAKLQVNLFFA
jgi:hypothetical protein